MLGLGEVTHGDKTLGNPPTDRREAEAEFPPVGDIDKMIIRGNSVTTVRDSIRRKDEVKIYRKVKAEGGC